MGSRNSKPKNRCILASCFLPPVDDGEIPQHEEEKLQPLEKPSEEHAEVEVEAENPWEEHTEYDDEEEEEDDEDSTVYSEEQEGGENNVDDDDGEGQNHVENRATSQVNGGNGGRFEKYFVALLNESNPTTQLVALNQLCEELSMCEEETISNTCCKSAVSVLVVLANNESNPDIMLIAIRAMTYLCDVKLESCKYLVEEGVLEGLCSKLMVIEYLDVAEQCIKVLEKISDYDRVSCLKGGVIMAVLRFIDFFSPNVQRVGLSVVANICMQLHLDYSSQFIEAVPILCDLLNYEDQKLVENVAICLTRIVVRVGHSSEMVDELCKHDLIHKITNFIALNAGTNFSQPINTDLIKILCRLASASMGAVKIIFELDISSTLKHILSNYDYKGGDVHSSQMHEVLKLLNVLLPPFSLNCGDTPVMSEKQKFILQQQEHLQQIGMDIVPVLIQVVNSGANLNVCCTCLSVINKILHYSKSHMLLDLLHKCNISSFLAGILSQKDLHVVVLALSIAKTALQQLPNPFLNSFRKEGVVYAILAILTSQLVLPASSNTQLPSSSKQEDVSNRGCLCYSYSTHKLPSSQTRTCKLKKTAVRTLAEFIKSTYLAAKSGDCGTGLTKTIQQLRTLCAELTNMVDASKSDDKGYANEEHLAHIVGQIMAELNGKEPLSTFEFIESGIVKSLLHYLSNGQYQRGKMDPHGLSNHWNVMQRRLEVFARFVLSSTQHWEDMPLAVLLKILQSAVSSMENFPVILNHAKLKRVRTTIPSENLTMGLKVRFKIEEGETTPDANGTDVEIVEALASSSAIGSHLWHRINRVSTEDDNSQNFVFYFEGELLDQKLTLYQAILQSKMKAEDDFVLGPNFWKEVYEISYGKASKLQKCNPQKLLDESLSTMREYPRTFWQKILSPMIVELPHKLKSSPTYETMVLLNILEVMNRYSSYLMSRGKNNALAEGKAVGVDNITLSTCSVPETEFVCSKLTAKLEQQMQDHMALSSGSIPSWFGHLMATFPFLFSFTAKCKYFRLTVFDSSQVQPHSLPESESSISSLAHIKYVANRDTILDSAAKIMDCHGNSDAILEVEYCNEVGTGLGPTIEFYTSASTEFQKVGLGMWRDDHGPSTSGKGLEPEDSGYMVSRTGLFPRPWSVASSSSNGMLFSDTVQKFILLGQVVARAFKDGRLLDLPLSMSFYKLILEQELNLYDIKSFDPELGKVLLEFQSLLDRKSILDSVSGKSAASVPSLYYQNTSIEDLCLDFTLPGYADYLLTSTHDQKMVNMTNLEEYVSSAVDATVNSGIFRQVEAFKSGFNQVLPIHSIQIFTAEELEQLLCGERDSWTVNDLLEHIKFDHGYTARSPPIISLVEILQEYECKQQRAFLQFVTGAPRLPLGGLAALKPKLTVVHKQDSDWADGELPSVMTCANYLKLPPYSTKEIMRERLSYAITEGQGSFHLS